MKKRPIYLYVLLGLSSVLSLYGAWGLFTGSVEKTMEVLSEAYSQANLPDNQIQEILQPMQKVIEFNFNAVNKALVVVGLLLLLMAVIMLFRKNLLMANLSYLVYIILSMMGSIYHYVSISAINRANYSNAEVLAAVQGQTNLSIMIGLGLDLIIIILILYKIWSQQKAAESEDLA